MVVLPRFGRPYDALPTLAPLALASPFYLEGRRWDVLAAVDVEPLDPWHDPVVQILQVRAMCRRGFGEIEGIREPAEVEEIMMSVIDNKGYNGNIWR